ncbi:MAG: histidinol dehydrogenase [Sphingomonadaceae bacterium]
MIRMHTADPDFAQAFERLVESRRDGDADVSRDVAAILNRVRSEGDAAIAALTVQFDGHDQPWRIARDDCAAAYRAIDGDLRAALDLAAARIRAYHARQRPIDTEWTDDTGVTMGARWSAVEAAGLYVPGGRAAYPSSVLMNAIPARVAGVDRLVMVTPTPGGEANIAVLAAAHLAGIDEVWRIGGAQAIAALAFGTVTIAPVDVIVGPGNAWVAEAKRQLYGRVGIDMVAGPSEILVVADAHNDPEWIAADLLSQAEHDPTSQSILLTDDGVFADAVIAAVDRLIPTLATAAVARASWDAHGAVIVLAAFHEAPALIDRLAPEHLALAVADPQALFARVRHAGSVFLGRHTPEAIGDYLGGPNHVLPTGRRARFSSGLGVTDFMKRTSFLSATPTALAQLGPAGMTLANAEGLPAHAASIAARL